jgi:hypothetical protein
MQGQLLGGLPVDLLEEAQPLDVGVLDLQPGYELTIQCLLPCSSVRILALPWMQMYPDIDGGW